MSRLLLSISIVICSFNLLAVDAAFPPALRLPLPQDFTTRDVLYLLKGMQKQWPTAFEGGNDFGVNSVQLIKEEKALLDILSQHPGYVESFADRRYLSLTMSALSDIQTTSLRISSKAVLEWKNNLRNHISEIQSGNDISPKSILESKILAYRQFLTTKITLEETNKTYRGLLTKIWGADFESPLANTLKSIKFRKKNPENQLKDVLAIIDSELNKSGIRDEYKNWLLQLQQFNNLADIKTYALGLQFDELTQDFFRKGLSQNKLELKELNIITNKLGELLNTPKISAPKALFLTDRIAKVNQAKELFSKLLELNQQLEAERKKAPAQGDDALASLGQLYAVLEKHDPDFDNNFAGKSNAEGVIRQLTDDDLDFFDDMDALEKPFSSWFPELKPLVYQAFSHYARQKRTYSTTLEKGESLFLQEIPPLIGIFRGLIGGDCSSKYSFPYPNDIREKVFVVRPDPNSPPIGILSATVVNINHNNTTKKALYLVTIAGKKLKAKDVELIFRGLSHIKAVLAVDEIVIPEKKNLSGLINHTRVRGVYQQHSNPDNMVEIKYIDTDLRLKIENFPSENNTGHYDKMMNNRLGTVLNDFPDSTVRVKCSSKIVEPTTPIPMDNHELIKFALAQHSRGRHDIVQAVVDLMVEDRLFTLAQIQEFFAVLDNRHDCSHHKDFDYLKATIEQNLTVDEHERAMREILKKTPVIEWENQTLLRFSYQGRLRAPDALSAVHKEKTVQMVVEDILQNQTPLCGGYYVMTHRDELAVSSSFRPVFEKIWKIVERNNGEESVRALEVYFMLLPANAVLTVNDRKGINDLVRLSSDIRTLVNIRVRLLGGEEQKNWPETQNVDAKIAHEIKNMDLGRLCHELADILKDFSMNEVAIQGMRQQFLVRLENFLAGLQDKSIRVDRNILNSFCAPIDGPAADWDELKIIFGKIATVAMAGSQWMDLFEEYLQIANRYGLKHPRAVEMLNALEIRPIDIGTRFFEPRLWSDLFSLASANPESDLAKWSDYATTELIRALLKRNYDGFFIMYLNNTDEPSQALLIKKVEKMLPELFQRCSADELNSMLFLLSRSSSHPLTFFIALMDERNKRGISFKQTSFDEHLLLALLNLGQKALHTEAGQRLLDEMFDSLLNFFYKPHNILTRLLNEHPELTQLLVDKIKVMAEELLTKEGNSYALHVWSSIVGYIALIPAEQLVAFGSSLEAMDHLGQEIISKSYGYGQAITVYGILEPQNAFNIFPKTAGVVRSKMTLLASLDQFLISDFVVIHDYLQNRPDATELLQQFLVKTKESFAWISDPSTMYQIFMHFREDLATNDVLRQDFAQSIANIMTREQTWIRDNFGFWFNQDADFWAYCEELYPETAVHFPR
jgi:hypothetical protein